MRLNKRERQAFDALREILDNLEKGEEYFVPIGDQRAIEEVFGINLYKNTYRKSQVKEFKRGKGDAFLILGNQLNREPYPYGFFEYQIKKHRREERKNEIREAKEFECELAAKQMICDLRLSVYNASGEKRKRSYEYNSEKIRDLERYVMRNSEYFSETQKKKIRNYIKCFYMFLGKAFDKSLFR